MNSLKSTKEHYQLAVELVVSQAQKDPNIIAAILYGSLSHDQVWEKSDLDLWLITVDNPKNTNFYSLVSNDIFMHVDLIPRGQFKRSLESGLVNSWSEMVFVRSTLLFSKDRTIQTWYQNHHRFQVGEQQGGDKVWHQNREYPDSSNSQLPFLPTDTSPRQHRHSVRGSQGSTTGRAKMERNV